MKNKSSLASAAVAGLLTAGIGLGAGVQAFADHHEAHGAAAKHEKAKHEKGSCSGKEGCAGKKAKEKHKEAAHHEKAEHEGHDGHKEGHDGHEEGHHE